MPGLFFTHAYARAEFQIAIKNTPQRDKANTKPDPPKQKRKKKKEKKIRPTNLKILKPIAGTRRLAREKTVQSIVDLVLLDHGAKADLRISGGTSQRMEMLDSPMALDFGEQLLPHRLKVVQVQFRKPLVTSDGRPHTAHP